MGNDIDRYGIGNFAASHVPASKFPVRVNPSNSHQLINGSGSPIYLIGDTAWSLVVSITEADALYYLQTRADQGFNTILFDATVLDGIISGSPLNADGDAPFNGTLAGGQYDVSTVPAPGDTTSSAAKYWAHVENLISAAHSYGLLIVFDVYDTYCTWLYTGYLDGNSPSSHAQLQAYGNFLGQRFGAVYNNIIWMFGNDYVESSAGDVDMTYVIQGIQQYASDQEFTMEGWGSTAGKYGAFDSDATLKAYMTINGVYMYSKGPFRSEYLSQYNRSDYGPIINLEAAYENNTNLSATPKDVRAEHYVFFLNGAVGDIYGNEPVGGVVMGGPFASDWKSRLTSQGAQEMIIFSNFINGISWSQIIPDQTSFVFSSLGTPNDYSGAYVSDGSLAIAYRPSLGNFVVNMARFRGSVTAQWFDPTNGDYSTISGSPFANSGSHTFTSSSNNSDGAGDWVLLLTA